MVFNTKCKSSEMRSTDAEFTDKSFLGHIAHNPSQLQQHSFRKSLVTSKLLVSHHPSHRTSPIHMVNSLPIEQLIHLSDDSHRRLAAEHFNSRRTCLNRPLGETLPATSTDDDASVSSCSSLSELFPSRPCSLRLKIVNQKFPYSKPPDDDSQLHPRACPALNCHRSSSGVSDRPIAPPPPQPPASTPSQKNRLNSNSGGSRDNGEDCSNPPHNRLNRSYSSSSSSSPSSSSSNSSSTSPRCNDEPAVIEFSVKNFWKVAKQQNDIESSEVGYCRGFYYRLLIHPKGTAGTDSEASHLSVFLEAVRQDWFPDDWVFPNVKFELTVVNFRDPKQSVTSWAHWSFSNEATSRGWQKMLTHSRLSRTSGFMDDEGTVLIRGKAEPPYSALWSRSPIYRPKQLWTLMPLQSTATSSTTNVFSTNADGRCNAAITSTQPSSTSASLLDTHSLLQITDQVVPSIKTSLNADFLTCFVLILFHIKVFRREIYLWNTYIQRPAADFSSSTGNNPSCFAVIEALQKTFAELQLWPLAATACSRRKRLSAKHDQPRIASKLTKNLEMNLSSVDWLRQKLDEESTSSLPLTSMPSIRDVMKAINLVDIQKMDLIDPLPAIHSDLLSLIHRECQLSYVSFMYKQAFHDSKAATRAYLDSTPVAPIPNNTTSTTPNLLSSSCDAQELDHALRVLFSTIPAPGMPREPMSAGDYSTGFLRAKHVHSMYRALEMNGKKLKRFPEILFIYLSQQRNTKKGELFDVPLRLEISNLLETTEPPRPSSFVDVTEEQPSLDDKVRHEKQRKRLKNKQQTKQPKNKKFPSESTSENVKSLLEPAANVGGCDHLPEVQQTESAPTATADKWYCLFAVILREGDVCGNGGGPQTSHTLLLRPEEDGPWFRIAQNRVEMLVPKVEFSEWKCHRDFFCAAAVYIAEDYIDAMANGEIDLEGDLKDINPDLYDQTLGTYGLTEESVLPSFRTKFDELTRQKIFSSQIDKPTQLQPLLCPVTTRYTNPTIVGKRGKTLRSLNKKATSQPVVDDLKFAPRLGYKPSPGMLHQPQPTGTMLADLAKRISQNNIFASQLPQSVCAASPIYLKASPIPLGGTESSACALSNNPIEASICSSNDGIPSKSFRKSSPVVYAPRNSILAHEDFSSKMIHGTVREYKLGLLIHHHTFQRYITESIHYPNSHRAFHRLLLDAICEKITIAAYDPSNLCNSRLKRSQSVPSVFRNSSLLNSTTSHKPTFDNNNKLNDFHIADLIKNRLKRGRSSSSSYKKRFRSLSEDILVKPVTLRISEKIGELIRSALNHDLTGLVCLLHHVEQDVNQYCLLERKSSSSTPSAGPPSSTLSFTDIDAYVDNWLERLWITTALLVHKTYHVIRFSSNDELITECIGGLNTSLEPPSKRNETSTSSTMVLRESNHNNGEYPVQPSDTVWLSEWIEYLYNYRNINNYETPFSSTNCHWQLEDLQHVYLPDFTTLRHPKLDIPDIVCSAVACVVEYRSVTEWLFLTSHGEPNLVTANGNGCRSQILSTSVVGKRRRSDTEMIVNESPTSVVGGSLTSAGVPPVILPTQDASEILGGDTLTIDQDYAHFLQPEDFVNAKSANEIHEYYLTHCMKAAALKINKNCSQNGFSLNSSPALQSLRGLDIVLDTLIHGPKNCRISINVESDLQGLEGFGCEQSPPVTRWITARRATSVATFYGVIRMLLLRSSSSSMRKPSGTGPIKFATSWKGGYLDSFMLYALVPDCDPTRKGRFRYTYMAPTDSLDAYCDLRRKTVDPDSPDLIVLIINCPTAATVPITETSNSRKLKGKHSGTVSSSNVPASTVAGTRFPRSDDLANPLLIFKWYDQNELDLVCVGARVCDSKKRLEDYIVDWVIPEVVSRGLYKHQGDNFVDIGQFVVLEEFNIRACQNVRRFNAAIKKINKRSGDVIIVQQKRDFITSPNSVIEKIGTEVLKSLSQQKSPNIPANNTMLLSETNKTNPELFGSSTGGMATLLGEGENPHSFVIPAAAAASEAAKKPNKRKKKSVSAGKTTIPPKIKKTARPKYPVDEEEEIEEQPKLSPPQTAPTIIIVHEENKLCSPALSASSAQQPERTTVSPFGECCSTTIPVVAAEAVLGTFPDTFANVMRECLEFEYLEMGPDADGVENLRVQLKTSVSPATFVNEIISASLSEILATPLPSRLSFRTKHMGDCRITKVSLSAAYHADRLFNDYLRDDKINQQDIVKEFRLALTNCILFQLANDNLTSESASPLLEEAPIENEAALFERCVSNRQLALLELYAAVFLTSDLIGTRKGLHALSLILVSETKTPFPPTGGHAIGGSTSSGGATKRNNIIHVGFPSPSNLQSGIVNNEIKQSASVVTHQCTLLCSLCYLFYLLGSRQVVKLGDGQAGRRYFEILIRRLSDWLRRLSSAAFVDSKLPNKQQFLIRNSYWCLALVLKDMVCVKASFTILARETEAALSLASLPFSFQQKSPTVAWTRQSSSKIPSYLAGRRKASWAALAMSFAEGKSIGGGTSGDRFEEDNSNVEGGDDPKLESSSSSTEEEDTLSDYDEEYDDSSPLPNQVVGRGWGGKHHPASLMSIAAAVAASPGKLLIAKPHQWRNEKALVLNSTISFSSPQLLHNSFNKQVDGSGNSNRFNDLSHFLDRKTGRPRVSKDCPRIVHESRTWFVTYKPAFWHCSGPTHCVDRALDLHRLKHGDIEKTLKNVTDTQMQHSGRMESFHIWLMKKFPLLETIRRWTELECGLCHRIDLETSGAVLIARTRRARDFLWDQFRRRNVHKEYLLLCHGRIQNRFGVVKTRLLTKDYDNRSKIKSHFTQVVEEGGEDSLTEYHLCRVYRRKKWSDLISNLIDKPPIVGEYVIPNNRVWASPEKKQEDFEQDEVASSSSSSCGDSSAQDTSSSRRSSESIISSERTSGRRASNMQGRIWIDPSLTGENTEDEELSLCKCRIVTGRTHQIRVHMRHIGHPLVSDTKYLDSKKCLEDRQWCPRMFLHAAVLEFADPDNPNSFVEALCPLAHELVQALDSALICVDDYEPTSMLQYGIPNQTGDIEPSDTFSLPSK